MMVLEAKVQWITFIFFKRDPEHAVMGTSSACIHVFFHPIQMNLIYLYYSFVFPFLFEMLIPHYMTQ